MQIEMNCDISIQTQQDVFSVLAAWGSVVEVRPASIAALCPRLSKFLIKLDEIKFGDAIFRLNAPISVALYEEEGVWYCENQDFSSLAFGASPIEAVSSFYEDFSVLWHEIAEAPDETLTDDAQKVKEALRVAVKEVETERRRCP